MNERWVLIDIGNSVAKGALYDPVGAPSVDVFERWADAPLEQPERIASLLGLADDQRLRWFVSSVNRPAEERLQAWVARERPRESYRRLTFADCPLTLEVDVPSQVGFDRLATAMAADCRRATDEAAIVVDAGTALKVHAVSATSQFLGGVILPGFRMASRALQQGTDLLPMVDASLNISAPDVFGRNTQAAIRAGLFWGAVGAVREVAGRMRRTLGERTPVFVTGGDARGLGVLIDHGVTFVPHLCLEGIVHIARRLSES